MKAVILAAGEGTRLNKGWTIVPKPLLEIGEKTIIEHVIVNLRKAGLNEFIIVTGFMSEHIKDYLLDGTSCNVKISYLYNQNYKEDLLSSLSLARKHIDGPFILCMADLFFKSSVIKGLLNYVDNNGSNDNHYMCISRNLSKVRRIEEKVKVQTKGENLLQASLVLPQFDAIDCAIYFMQPSIFITIEKCIHEGKRTLPLVINELALKNKFKVYNLGEEEVVDIDREKDIVYVLSEVSKNATR